MTIVAVDGVSSPVVVAGEGEPDEAVVFVHGNPGTGRDWTELIERVSPFARSVAPDMPGYGDSDKPRSFDYSPAGYARHLEGLLDQLNVRRAHLVLHDFGTLWGLEWALQNPAAAASVTLLGEGVFSDFRWHFWARVWRTPVLGELVNYTTPRAVARAVLARENPRLAPEQTDQLSRVMSESGTRRAILACYRRTPAEKFVYRAGPDGRERRVDLLRELDLPALVLWPTDDRYVPFQPHYQHEGFPSARVEVFEDHGHWFHWEAPERTAELVVAFLREQTAKKALGAGR